MKGRKGLQARQDRAGRDFWSEMEVPCPKCWCRRVVRLHGHLGLFCARCGALAGQLELPLAQGDT